MASLYRKQKSPFWYLRSVGIDGKWKDVSLKLRTGIHEETRRARQICAEATAKELSVGTSGKGAAFDQWVPDFIASHFTKDNGTRLRVEYGWFSIREYLRSLDIGHPAQVTRDVCQRFLGWATKTDRATGRRALHHNTALLALAYFRQILGEAALRGFIPSNPASRLGISRIKAKEKRALTDDEIGRIFEELKRQPEWMERCFRVALCQGVRISETRVPMRDVHLDQNLIVFGKTKGDKPFGAVIHPELRPLLERLKHEGAEFVADTPKTASSLFHRLFRRLGIDTSFHATRVTVVTRMAIAGVDQRLAMAYVNHSSRMVHAIYTKLRPEHALAVTAALNYGSAMPGTVPGTSQPEKSSDAPAAAPERSSS